MIWKIQRYLDFILKRRTNFQIQIMKKFFLHFIIRINHPFFVSIYVPPIKVLDYERQKVKDRALETKYRINRARERKSSF